jgi:predicted NBD/HSP70 family sugar kinase
MYVVVDIGGTNTRIGVSPDAQSLEKSEKFPTNPDPKVALKEISLMIKKLIGRDPVTAVAAGVTGVMDQARSKLISSPHLQNWEGTPLKKLWENELETKVYWENDAALGGLGEAVFGVARRKRITAFITVSTGIGGARITEGKIDPSVWGFEPGHHLISVGEKIKEWEEFASGSAMEKIYGKKPEDIDSPEAWSNEARMLALGLHNVAVFWSPDMIVLGGALCLKIPLDELRMLLKEEMHIFPEVPPIEPGTLGDKCGLYGGMALLTQLERA